jgi:hypothetical protein
MLWSVEWSVLLLFRIRLFFSLNFASLNMCQKYLKSRKLDDSLVLVNEFYVEVMSLYRSTVLLMQYKDIMYA